VEEDYWVRAYKSLVLPNGEVFFVMTYWTRIEDSVGLTPDKAMALEEGQAVIKELRSRLSAVELKDFDMWFVDDWKKENRNVLE